MKWVRFIIKPLLSAALTTAIWYFTKYVLGIIPSLEGDEEALANGTAPMVGVFWSLIAGFSLNQVWKEWSFLFEAVRMKDIEAFRKHKDKRIPRAIKVLLGMLSILLLLIFSVIPYRHIFTGVFTIFLISFILVLYIVVAEDIDNPFAGVYNIMHLPADWESELRNNHSSLS